MDWVRDSNKPDTFDCRKRSWMIETATCSKDVVILLGKFSKNHRHRFPIVKVQIHVNF